MGHHGAGNTSEVVIFLGNGNGTFNYGNTYAAPNSTDFNPGSNSLFVADFNGDGKLDLAALTPYNGVFIYLGNGDGTFQTAVGYSTVDPNHPNNYTAFGLAVGDLNGDGKMDIAVTENLRNGRFAEQWQRHLRNGHLLRFRHRSLRKPDGHRDWRCQRGQEERHRDYGLLRQCRALSEPGQRQVCRQRRYRQTGGILPWLVSIADINGDKKTGRRRSPISLEKSGRSMARATAPSPPGQFTRCSIGTPRRAT